MVFWRLLHLVFLIYAPDFLSVIYTPELLLPGHLFNYLIVDDVIDLFATGNIIWIWSLISSWRKGPGSLLEMVSFRGLLLQNLELQQQMSLVYLNMNRKKTAGLEDTKAVYVKKLLRQYYEPGTGTCSHQPYSNVVYSQTDICHLKA